MVGKKKTSYVQFFTEISDVVHTVEGGRRSAFDPDEIEEEVQEKLRVQKVSLSILISLTLHFLLLQSVHSFFRSITNSSCLPNVFRSTGHVSLPSWNWNLMFLFVKWASLAFRTNLMSISCPPSNAWWN